MVADRKRQNDLAAFTPLQFPIHQLVNQPDTGISIRRVKSLQHDLGHRQGEFLQSLDWNQQLGLAVRGIGEAQKRTGTVRCDLIAGQFLDFNPVCILHRPAPNGLYGLTVLNHFLGQIGIS